MAQTTPDPGKPYGGLWTPPEKYLAPGCKGAEPGESHSCTVGVRVIGGKLHGCEHECHDVEVARLKDISRRLGEPIT
ncbi:hypothetical protein DN069_20550 [Streptacidiphilus pinicola]|uniref:Uncharacterized protein n=1 Tax=Streptacidiphilus pinicola TaxID=2219663 RepID=A0A2X0J8E4_9ACTN|nr:hypothetical protein [Streptacidiphilus pinicola]RAG83758.1 hypothetical protein DN069_20550 [Streptacidiphilus pinicola]